LASLTGAAADGFTQAQVESFMTNAQRQALRNNADAKLAIEANGISLADPEA